MQKNLIPMEWFVATLAALTIPLFVLANVPVWATYITWGAAFLVGPNEAIRKLYPTLIVGTISGVIFFTLALTIDPIIGLVALPNSLIAFGMTLGLLYLARIPVFALVPGIFFGFACFVGRPNALPKSNPTQPAPRLTGSRATRPPTIGAGTPTETHSKLQSVVIANTPSTVCDGVRSGPDPKRRRSSTPLSNALT